STVENSRELLYFQVSSCSTTTGLDSAGLSFVGHVSEGVISVNVFLSLSISLFLQRRHHCRPLPQLVGTPSLSLALSLFPRSRGTAFALLWGSNIPAFSAEEVPCISAVVVALLSEVLLL
ncbi:hypothetical protein PanWU01x14_020370, partial [Parasponia andersonii]